MAQAAIINQRPLKGSLPAHKKKGKKHLVLPRGDSKIQAGFGATQTGISTARLTLCLRKSRGGGSVGDWRLPPTCIAHPRGGKSSPFEGGRQKRRRWRNILYHYFSLTPLHQHLQTGILTLMNWWALLVWPMDRWVWKLCKWSLVLSCQLASTRRQSNVGADESTVDGEKHNKKRTKICKENYEKPIKSWIVRSLKFLKLYIYNIVWLKHRRQYLCGGVVRQRVGPRDCTRW